VALLGVPSRAAHLAEILERRAPEIMQVGEGEVETIGMRVRVGRPMLLELRTHDALADLAALDAEVFIIHSKSDEVASVDHADALFAAARAPKSLMLLDGADHLLLAREADGHVVGKTVAAWAEGILLARSG
jgi:pimeloyl-ACP methyl ester carboxylesterase